MNVYEKIQNVKLELLNSNLKKSGENKYSGFKYFELADFLPTLIKLCADKKLFTSVSFNNDYAELTIVNTEAPEERVIYTSPMEELELKGCNKIQALGGTETYSRRYLYMSAFDIVEADLFDATAGTGKNEEIEIGERKLDQTKLATLIEVAKGIETEAVLKVLNDYGYKSSKEIKVKDFKNIYNALKELKQ